MAEKAEAAWFADSDAYEQYIGRWSRLIGGLFLDWLSLPASLHWVDVGCGTGALTETVLNLANPIKVTGVEPSREFLETARHKIDDDRVEFKSGIAMSLPINDSEVDVIVGGAVLNFLPNKEGAIQEFCRVVRPGGTIAMYVWDYAGEMQLIRYFWNAVCELFPDAVELDEGRLFPICDPEPLYNLFISSSLASVEVQALETPTIFSSFDDYWSPFLRGQGPAGAYCGSLSEKDRERLRSRLEESVPTNSDGSIHLIARAWAVRGTIRV
ncbi:MAG: methyltransferase domain-containing protein [Chloroflexi bacterium]|nr:methyltransferase domain-containing protein [Chloroflexota bacterium]